MVAMSLLLVLRNADHLLGSEPLGEGPAGGGGGGEAGVVSGLGWGGCGAVTGLS